VSAVKSCDLKGAFMWGTCGSTWMFAAEASRGRVLPAPECRFWALADYGRSQFDLEPSRRRPASSSWSGIIVLGLGRQWSGLWRRSAQMARPTL